MKYLALLLIFGFGISGSLGQTIKSLGYNTTNWQVVANTGTNALTFTNEINVSSQRINIGAGLGFWDGVDSTYALFFQGDDPVLLNSRWNDPSVRTSLGFSTNLNTLWTATNASNARSAMGLGATWLTNTDSNNFRTAIGLGASQSVGFAEVIASTALEAGSSTNIVIIDGDGINFGHSGIASTTRTNLGLGGGITATNTFVSYDGTNYTTNTVTISNGVITGWTQ